MKNQLMKKHTKLLAILIVFALIMPLVPFTAIAEEGIVTVLVPPTMVYDIVYPFSDGLAMVGVNIGFEGYSRTDKYGFIDKDGNEVVPPTYNYYTDSFHDGMALVVRDGKYGYIDTTGEEIVPLIYDYDFYLTSSYSEGMAAVCFDGRWGYVDKTGREIIPPKYDEAYPFRDGLALIRIDGICGYIDQTGYEIVPPKYDDAYFFSDGLAVVNIGGYSSGKWGFIDNTGEEIVPLKYDYARSFSYDLAAVESEGRWGYINRDGDVVVEIKYDSAWPLYDGMAQMRIDGQRGYINDRGEEITMPYYSVYDTWDNVDVSVPRYDMCYDFTDGFAKVFSRGYYDTYYRNYITQRAVGFIDKTGNEVVPMKYYDALDFSGGLAAVQISEGNFGGKWGYVDKNGNEVIPPIYDDIRNIYDYGSNLVRSSHYFSEGMAVVCSEGKYGYIDKTGEVVVPLEYDIALPVSEGLAVVGIRNEDDGYKWGLLSVDIDNEPEPTIPVTNITNIPTTATAGTPLVLSGTVVPTDATNKTISWQITDPGSTGATL